mgnify:CR=1 FL=1
MIDENFIAKAYSTMERGIPDFRKRKRQIARRFVLKNFLNIIFVKPEKNYNSVFLLHPKLEVQKIFADAFKLDINSLPFLNKALFYIQLGYISPNTRIRVWAANKGFNYLQYYFNSSNITIINCGPSILSPFLVRLCENKKDSSTYYIIQHGLYQMDYKPYEFEFNNIACKSVVWSELLAQNYISQGMDAQKIQVLPTHLFRTINELNKSKKVLIIGESINKINKNFDIEYQQKIKQVVQYLKQNSDYNEFYFKKHPRALPSLQLEMALADNSIKILNKINLSDYGLLIGAVSTLMIEGLAVGCRVIQLSMEKFQINVGDYSLYTSIENLRDIKEIKEKIDRINNLKKNYINPEFLRVEDNFEDYYKKLLEQ